jgi:conserved oligomeric Golgi complex subunit 4
LRLDSATDDINEKNYLDQSFALLQKSKQQLQEIVNMKYDQAFKNNNIPELERFFKIFPLIDESDNGLKKFSIYLCQQITETARKNFEQLLITDKNDQRYSIMFADALILLFEKVARVIEAYQPLIETYYGHGNMFTFIKYYFNLSSFFEHKTEFLLKTKIEIFKRNVICKLLKY